MKQILRTLIPLVGLKLINMLSVNTEQGKELQRGEDKNLFKYQNSKVIS